MIENASWSEEKLIAAIIKGGALREEASNHLLNTYISFIPKMVEKVGLSKEMLLDAYTDALMSLLEQISNDKFKAESKLSTYFYRIFYFKSIDLSRKNSTNKIEYQENLPERPISGLTALEKLETKDAIRDLHTYLDELGEPCKQILLDWGFWGYNMSEIATRVGLKSSKQAKNQKYKCLQKLRKLMN